MPVDFDNDGGIKAHSLALTGSATLGGARMGVAGTPLSVYAAGTAYSLTNTSAAVTFGTTSPSLTISAAGTYLLMGRANLKYNAATFAANQTITTKLRRTNNTATDVTGAATTQTTRIITTITDHAATAVIPPTIYTTTNANDAIAMYSALSAAPGAGSVDVTEAEIVAIRLY